MTGESRRRVHVVVPAGVDDPRRPSGGNVYDRRVCTGLRARGWAVREHAVPGTWPRPAPAARRALAAGLAAIPAGGVVLVDGLVGSAAPEALRRASRTHPLVALVHMPLGEAPEAAGADGAAARERAALLSCAAVLTTSAWTRGALLARYPLAGDRVVVAEPGTDPAGLAAGTPNGGRLLCVGAVTPAKGPDLLVAALESLAGLTWECRLVGSLDVDPGFVAGLRTRVEEGPTRGRVRLDGPLAGGGLAAAYHEADLLVLASHRESYGMVVAEALARGLPVVASCVGGVPEALGAEGAEPPGVLVPPGDAGALARALRRWLEDARWRQRLRAAARARRRTLPRWDRTAERVAAVLAEAAS